MNISAIQKEIRDIGTSERAKAHLWFFKTGKGQYGYGDKFLGLTVPQSRVIARKYKDLSLSEIKRLLMSEYHEERLIALIILVGQYKKADESRGAGSGFARKEEIYDFYLSHTKWINNWDLVDLSAGYIVGEQLLRHSGKRGTSASRIARSQTSQDDGIVVLEKLARSESVWERRIAIIATFAFIKQGEAKPTFVIAEMLLHDKHDLIQKAVGWMLREIGKRVSQEQEEGFLKKHYKTMPRTMLRYAIERFNQDVKKSYMTGSM